MSLGTKFLAVLGGVSLLLAFGGPLRAADDARVKAELEAGEFAAVAARAQQAADPAQRDALLGQMAVAQAQAGARQAAVRSVAQIGDDRTRAHILAQVGNQPVGGQGGQGQPGAQGGGNAPDFDSLIQLMTQTVAPKTWTDAGGIGTVSPFPTGVWVDTQGLLRPLLHEETAGELAALRTASAPRSGGDDARRESPLRMISLVRLEKQIQLGLALGREPGETMQVLAGLRRVKYVFVYPESGDLVLAGPAGDWTPGPEGRIVGRATGQPVLRLDDLVVVLRHAISSPDAAFGCLINPRQEGLARAQEFLKRWSNRAVPAEHRDAWLAQFRAALGKQDIEVYGLDPRTHAARVIVEADWRMKRVGMGLEPGVPGVTSYLNLMKQSPEEAAPVGVLRWWFTLNYDAVLAAKDRRAFAIRGQGVKVESENEHLTAEGKRVHTGQSDALNQQFARSFTEHFDALCKKYPIYAELRNLCDLALTAALVREERLAEHLGWHITCFADPQGYVVQLGEAPKEVESIANAQVVSRKRFVAGVSGGVRVRPAALVTRQAIEVDNSSQLQRQPAAPAGDRWWWD
jgi:hypothetical protein